jgi:hypothetical protein
LNSSLTNWPLRCPHQGERSALCIAAFERRTGSSAPEYLLHRHDIHLIVSLTFYASYNS